MNTLKQFNLAMHYIETHLTDDIDFHRMAQIACCSEYHFRRIFSYLSGMTLTDYIRQRRLSQAAAELQHGNLRIIDLAMKYGYTSADAFTRAFHGLHGVTPTEAREGGVTLRTLSPVTFQLSISGGRAMDYRIVEKGAFSIAGIQKRVPLLYRGVNPEIAAMWEELSEDEIAALHALSTGEPHGIVNASVNFDDGRSEGSLLDHYIGIVTTARVPEKWAVLSVQPSTWAVFTSRGKFPDTLQTTWGQIYAEWLVTSGWEVNEGPEILWTADDDETSPTFHSEIWIPIRKPSA